MQQPPGGARLFAAALGEIDVGPAGEAVLLVPGAFAVAEQNECGHGYIQRAASSPVRPGVCGRVGAELLFDAEQLVVLRHPIAAAGRAGLDLAGRGRHREIGDGRVLGLARAVRDDAGVAGLRRHRDRVERFGHRADLIQLDQDRVGDVLVDAASGESACW